jgi:hypothetical protein
MSDGRMTRMHPRTDISVVCSVDSRHHENLDVFFI